MDYDTLTHLYKFFISFRWNHRKNYYIISKYIWKKFGIKGKSGPPENTIG